MIYQFRIIVVLTILFFGTPLAAFEFDFDGSLGEDKNKHQRYVPPLSNPLFNETPYITTELRAIYFHQEISDSFLTGGGEINAGAAELRVAITERLGFIASKDGYVDIDFDAVLPDENGFANISVGLKYALFSDPSTDSILTVGVEYEPPTGYVETAGINLQGDGDGLIDIFLTGAKAFGKLGLQGNLGVNLAIDQDHDSSMLHYSVHVDYEILPDFYPLIEVNGFTTIDDGKRTPLNVEGVDLVNFGSFDSGTVVTVAGGARYRMGQNLILGAGYEGAVTDREDILDWRAYFDMVFHF